jgi:thiamine-phosphate pyrophosphorylase
VRGVVLREKDLPAPERATLAQSLRAVLDPVDGMLLVASGCYQGSGDQGSGDQGSGGQGSGDQGAGVHLAETDPAGRPAGAALVGRSCHDAAGVTRAARDGCDYVTVSPVFPSSSKPGYGPPLGTAGLAELVAVGRSVGVPVYALGGVDGATAAQARTAGATGIAVMGAVMSALDPEAVCRGLLDAWTRPAATPQ